MAAAGATGTRSAALGAPLLLTGSLAGAVALGGGGLLWWRRRRAAAGAAVDAAPLAARALPGATPNVPLQTRPGFVPDELQPVLRRAAARE
jgi:uncharacterized iron-regulated membrane protein